MTTATSRMSMIDVQLPLRYVSKKSRIAFSTKASAGKGSAGPAGSEGFYRARAARTPVCPGLRSLSPGCTAARLTYATRLVVAHRPREALEPREAFDPRERPGYRLVY